MEGGDRVQPLGNHTNRFVGTDVKPALHAVAPKPGVPDDVYVVRVDLDFGLALDDPIFDILSADERATASGFRQPVDAIRSAATRAALRQALAAELGRPAGSLAFIRSNRGRPALAGAGPPTLDFNVAHSGDYALIAWSRQRRVGVDIEVLRPDWDWRPLGRMVLGVEDARRIDAALDDIQRAALFFAVWTAKEALLKAEGRGITAGLDGFSVLSGDGDRPRLGGAGPVASSLSGHEAAWLSGIAGHAACLAWGPVTQG